MKIRLSDPDRERLGCPEWLDISYSLDVREAEALEKAGGDYTLYTAAGPGATRTRIWVGLHRAGVTVPFDELHFDLLGLTVEDVPVGKARSARGGSGTRSKSPASARRTRSRT